MINFFNCEGERDYKSTESFIFLQDLINRFGVFEICQNLLKVQNFSSDALNKNDTLFQAFLEHLLRDNIISKNEISEYFTDDKIKDFFKRNKFQADIKEGSYTFNPNKFHSIDKSIFSNYNKSFNKMDMNPMMESPYNSIDLRDDNLTKKELAKISLNENNSFLEKDIFFCLDKENTMKKKEENPNTSHHQYISLYSDMNIDMLSENSKSDHSKSGEFEEYQENRIKFASKKTIF